MSAKSPKRASRKSERVASEGSHASESESEAISSTSTVTTSVTKRVSQLTATPTVTAAPSTSTPPAASAGSSSGSSRRRSKSPLAISREQEKDELAHLNSQLACYIDFVRSQQNNAATVKRQYETLNESVTHEISQTTGLYEKEIESLRRQLDRIAKEKTELVVSLDKANADRARIEKALAQAEKLAKELQRQLDQLGDTEADNRNLRAENERLRSQLASIEKELQSALKETATLRKQVSVTERSQQESKRLQSELADCQAQLKATRDQLETEVKLKTDLENRMQTIAEDNQFKEEEEVGEEDEVDIGDTIDLRIGAAGVSALDFHPSDRRLACGTVDGRVRIYDTEGSLEEAVLRGRYHKCVRSVSFHGDGGQQLLSASSLGAFKLHDSRSGQLAAKNLKAHSCGINCILSLNSDQFVTGDEDGNIRHFDLRKSQSAVFSAHVQTDWRPQEEEEEKEAEADSAGNGAGGSEPAIDSVGLCGISQLCAQPGQLLAACEDGTLTSVSLHKRKIAMKSEFFGYPLTTISRMKSGAKLVAGTEDGCLLMFNNKELGNLCDRSAVVRNASIEAACSISDDVLVCACSDTGLYAVSVLPNCTLCCIGRQPSDSGQCLRVVADCQKSLLASASPDSSQIRLWATAQLPQLQKKQRMLQGLGRQRRRRKEEQLEEKEKEARPKAKKGRAFSAGAEERAAFLSGLL